MAATTAEPPKTTTPATVAQKEEPTHAPAATTPSPAVTTSQAATTPVAPTASEPPANDPLNSGVGLKNDEIKQKLILKALADVWVRYKVDERAPMRFMLRKDRILVLRAKTLVRLQVSNPKAVLFKPSQQKRKGGR